ncbi:MAG: C40 family peptidase [Bacteroidetes bacterium]|nr:C40 family peptidase [Bacteroidota bacterium]
MYGICNLSIVPCRKEPSDKSEMVTQLLFGEHFEVLEEKKSWTLIRIAYDGYECWIDKKQFLPLNVKGINDSTTAVSTDLVQLAEGENGKMISILLGSSLPKFSNKEFYLGKEKYSFEGEATFPFAKNSPLKKGDERGLSEIAKWYLNTPYLWGGRSPFGLDCSGFTQMVFKLCGIKLKRDAHQQAEQGTTLSFLEEAKEGDLAFFDNEEGRIVHVGILLGDEKIIHASGKVRIDKLDHQGIYNEDLKKYTHRLRVVKRFI